MAPTTATIHSFLNLPKSATRHQVNKACKKAAKATHPDKGGSDKAMATLNAAKDAYDNGGVTESDTSDGDDSDDGDDDGDVGINENESDGDYQDREGSLSDGESGSGSTAETSGGESDEEECAFDCNYGNTKEISGRYVAVLMEEVGLDVTIKKHEEICGCDLNDPETTHFLNGVDSNDGTDSGVEDLDADDDDNEDEVMAGEEADHIDEGFEDGDEDD